MKIQLCLRFQLDTWNDDAVYIAIIRALRPETSMMSLLVYVDRHKSRVYPGRSPVLPVGADTICHCHQAFQKACYLENMPVTETSCKLDRHNSVPGSASKTRIPARTRQVTNLSYLFRRIVNAWLGRITTIPGGSPT